MPDLVHVRRPDIQTFNELLVQYRVKTKKKIQQVVPDNMVVVHAVPIKADGSFNVPVQPVGPFWMLEYVSKSNKRKDYEDNIRKYETDLKVPYYLVFHPDEQELLLFRRSRAKYVSVKPNEHGRDAIPKLEIEVAILDGWVRFWFRGELLPLPADLQRQLDETKRRADDEARRADAEARRADEAERRAAEESRRATALEQRLAEMQRELARLRPQDEKGPSGQR
jgi:hypothetical protein